MNNILTDIIATKREELVRLKAAIPEAAIRAEAKAITRPVISFKKALKGSESGIIAEFKRRSPSKGFIKAGADAAGITAGYEKAGAAALSVLTDRSYFGGSEEDLKAARQIVRIPILRKDFIVDPYQICEARIWGADVILLIAATLSPSETAALAAFAHTLELEVLLEIHEASELEHLNENIDVIGVNNRNLHTFVTDVESSFTLAERLPRDVVKISESGLSDPETLRQLRQAGYEGFLMGENFMKQADPAQALADFLKAL